LSSTSYIPFDAASVGPAYNQWYQLYKNTLTTFKDSELQAMAFDKAVTTLAREAELANAPQPTP
jgi:hypothetical protein